MTLSIGASSKNHSAGTSGTIHRAVRCDRQARLRLHEIRIDEGTLEAIAEIFDTLVWMVYEIALGKHLGHG